MSDQSSDTEYTPMTFGVWLSMWLYAIACALPAIAFTDNSIPGIICLIAIPLVLIFPWWYANPALFVGIVMLLRGSEFAAAIWGTVAAVLATSFLVIAFYDAKAWEETRIGSWVWLLSLWTFAASACWAAWTRTHRNHPG